MMIMMESNKLINYYCCAVIFILFASVTPLNSRSLEDAPMDPFTSDESPELAVPRSPKINGPAVEVMLVEEGHRIRNLTCEYSGVPTPKVVWGKDGVEVEQLTQPLLKVENDPELGISTLNFPEGDTTTDDYNSTVLSGNYTCGVANFVGRAQKVFVLRFGPFDEEEPSGTTQVNSTPSQDYQETDDDDDDENSGTERFEETTTTTLALTSRS